VAALFSSSPVEEDAAAVGIGSVLLIPELLTKPLRDEADDEIAALSWLLARLDLRPVDASTADLSAILGSKHRLRAADAVHLATAVQSGAERFITNNRKDFGKNIDEIVIVYPDEL
jgi:predicted nucleic acid-binding protein